MRLRALAVPLLLPVVASTAIAQQTRVVTGTVTNAETNQPIADITVSAVGTTAGGVTDAQGRFRIVIPAGDQTLAARGIGYQRVTQRVPAGVASVTFRLARDVLRLDQVTVTGQTTTLSTRNATTAVSVVNTEEVTRAPAQSLEQALQGKVLGAKIDMNSGAPGGGAQIQIRGATSVLGNGQPLIVIDGVIASNDGFSSGSNSVTGAGGGLGNSQDAVVNRLADINPSEIESLEILKSAAATALYGSRATNGVVVIRTRRGAAGTSRVTFSQRVGTQEPLRYLGTRTFSSVDEVLNLPYGNGESGEDYLNEAFPSGTIPASANIALEREFYSRRTPSYQTLGTVTAGNERTSVFASGTLQRENGVAPRTGAQLMAGRFNVDQTITPRLRASISANITRNLLRRGLSNNDNTGTSPIYNFAYTPGVIDLRQRDASGLYIDNPFNGGGNATSNPFETFDFLKLDETTWRSIGALTVNYSVLETPKNRVALQGQAGFDRYQIDGQVYSPGFLQYEGGLDNFVGRATQTNVNNQNYNYNANVTHTFTPGRVASFTTTLGAGFEQQGFDLARYRARGLLPGVTAPQLGGSPNLQAEGNRELFRDQNVVLTEQILAFDERLALTGGVRFDRSSAYGDRSNWYAFPRVSASYRLDTPFIPGLDNIKPRVGYGQTGNRPRFTDRFLVLGTGGSIGGLTSLVSPATVNNPGITPERLTETEVGADLSFLRQRATLEASFYDRTITDLLFFAPLAASTGYTQQILNTGRLGNRGFELGVAVVPVQNNTVTWTSRVNLTRNRQRVDQLPPEIPRYNVPGSFGAAFGRNAIVEGQLTTAIYGNVPYTVRQEQRNGATVNVPGVPQPKGYLLTNPTAVAGTDYVIVDTIIGNSNPRLLTNFNNSIGYKRLTFNFTVDWRLGGDVANMTHLLYDEGGLSRDYTNASPIAGTPLGQYRYDAWAGGNDARMYVESGTNLRLRDAALSFDAPEVWAQRIRARTLRFNLQGRNLLMRTNYWGYDPEFNNFGNTNLNRFIDLAPYPGVRQFSLSVDLGF